MPGDEFTRLLLGGDNTKAPVRNKQERVAVLKSLDVTVQERTLYRTFRIDGWMFIRPAVSMLR
jgi:hypothetical protein